MRGVADPSFIDELNGPFICLVCASLQDSLRRTELANLKLLLLSGMPTIGVCILSPRRHAKSADEK